jgi:hypothetical protein
MSTSHPIDVRDMAIVHRTFRSAYEESAQLVRARPTPSPGRVRFLADHIDFGLEMLHHHHASEDLLLYPLLMERVPEQAAMTDGVSHEHQVVQTALNSALAACAAWRQHPTVETGEALAVTLEHLNEVLQPHLDDEEQQVVPLAAVTLTQEEWDAVGEHSSSHIPRARRAVALGMILEPLDEDDRNYMKRNLPGPVRLLYPLMVQRPWTRYASMLRSGP